MIRDSPLLGAEAPPPHKPCDVSRSMKGRAPVRADLSGSDLQVWSQPRLRTRPGPERPEEGSGMERVLRRCRIQNQLIRECLAECLGVFVLIVSLAPVVGLKIRIRTNQCFS